MTDSIDELRRAVITFRDERDWEQFHQLKDLALGLQIEAAELAELLLWKTPEECRDLVSDEAGRSRLVAEMADVLIFLLYLAEETGVSLGQAVRDKLQENAAKYPVEKAKGSAAKWPELLEPDSPVQGAPGRASESRTRSAAGNARVGLSRAIAVDWSGAQAGAKKKIWLCEVEGGVVRRLENGRSREEIADHLIEEARRDPALVVGLDFAFSFPEHFVRRRGHARVEDLWRDVEENGESWLADCPPPFWGKPGKKKPRTDEPGRRVTELALADDSLPRPFSVFQIGGAGAVGVGTVRGLPIVRRLRNAGFSIWPFHEPEPPLVVEIWPRLFMGNLKKSQRAARRAFLREWYPDLGGPVRAAATDSDDAFDALISALEMDRHLEEFAKLQLARDAASRVEGKIWRPGAGDV